MNAQSLALAFFLITSGKQVAFVDLSMPAKTPETGPQTVTVRGGRIYDGGVSHPQPGTLPVSLKLIRVVTTKEGEFIKAILNSP